MMRTLREDSDGDRLGFDTLTYTRDVAESKALNHRKGPGVIIAASGMCEGGRVLHHLRNHATRAEIRRTDAYSAHAHRTELRGWAAGVGERGNVRGWFLVHGEPEAQDAQARDLFRRRRGPCRRARARTDVRA